MTRQTGMSSLGAGLMAAAVLPPPARYETKAALMRRVISNQPDGTFLYEEYESDVRRSARTRFVFVGPFTQKDGRTLYRDGSPVWRTDLWALLGGMGAEWYARAMSQAEGLSEGRVCAGERKGLSREEAEAAEELRRAFRADAAAQVKS